MIKSRVFCHHKYDYRDILIKNDNKYINNTLFENHFRCCTKCGKTQRGNKMPGRWGEWINIPDMNLSKYPKNIPIVSEVRLYGEPTKQEKRQNKLDMLIDEE